MLWFEKALNGTDIELIFRSEHLSCKNEKSSTGRFFSDTKIVLLSLPKNPFWHLYCFISSDTAGLGHITGGNEAEGYFAGQ